MVSSSLFKTNCTSLAFVVENPKLPGCFDRGKQASEFIDLNSFMISVSENREIEVILIAIVEELFYFDLYKIAYLLLKSTAVYMQDILQSESSLRRLNEDIALLDSYASIKLPLGKW
ncbi:hypothetical protein ACS0TY_015448 [Phlomoides rotata]